MKSIIGFFAVIFCLASAAQADLMTCRLEAGHGPFDTFRLTLPNPPSDPDGILGHMKTGDSVRITGQLNDASGLSVGVQPVRKNVSATVDDLPTVDLLFDHDDLATFSIHLREDDDGLSAYVEYSSDGPYLTSFYRCN